MNIVFSARPEESAVVSDYLDTFLRWNRNGFIIFVCGLGDANTDLSVWWCFGVLSILFLSAPSCSATDGVVRKQQKHRGHQRYLLLTARKTQFPSTFLNGTQIDDVAHGWRWMPGNGPHYER